MIASVSRLPKVRPPKPRAELLSAAEASWVIAATPAGWRRTWVLVRLRAGIRLGEGLALKWSDVDLTTGSLRIRATRWRGLEGTPKGGRERTVPLSDDARATLAAHRHLRGRYVFCHEDGSPFTDWDVREVVPKACKAAGIGRRVSNQLASVPDGIRTRVTGLKGQRPGPLDDGDMSRGGIEPPTLGLKGRCSTS